MFLSCSYSTWHANLMGSSWFHGFTGPRWGTPRVTLDTRQVGDGEKKHGSQHSAHHFWPTGPGVPGISYIAAGWPGAQWSLCQLCCTAWSRRPLPSPVLCLPLTPVASTLFCGRLSQSCIWGQEGITERYMIPALENAGAKCPAGGKNLANKLCQICVSHTKVTVVKTC